MLGSDLVAGVEDLLIGQFEDDRFLGSFAHLTLKQFFEFLPFLDDRVKFFSDDFIVALLKVGTSFA